MSLMDTPQPQTVTVTGARKVLVMSKRDDAEDLKKNEELQKQMDLTRYLKAKSREEAQIQRRNDAIRSLKLRRLRDTVRKDKARWDKSVKALEEFLNETLP